MNDGIKALLIASVVSLILLFIVEFTVFSVKGKWLNDKEYLPIVKNILAHTKEKNPNYYIYTSGMPSVRIGASILTDYCIEGMGLIPRWTKMSAYIDHWIDSTKIAYKNEIANY